MKNQHFNPLFIGHGSPMNALEVNSYTAFLNRQAAKSGKPAVVIVISAHWQTRETFITGSSQPAQIYDFYGFPNELYQIKYAPPGSVETALFLQEENIGIQVDLKRGIDHAAWAVVKHLYPEQDVPVLELSLDVNKSTAEHYQLGRLLAKYCDQGILFIGSGNLVHNLREISFDGNEKPFKWAVEADKWFAEQIKNNNSAALIDYKNQLPDYQRSVPTDEHFLPLLYIMAMKQQEMRVQTIYEDIQNGSISMRSIEVEPIL